MATIPESHVDLLTGPVYLAVATVNPNGQPQVTPMWGSYDGTQVLLNTVRGRKKERNMVERPMVTILAMDPANPYRWIQVQGTVEMSEDGARAHIDELAKLYRGVDSYYGGVQPAEMEGTETRVIAKLSPKTVVVFPPA
jgi:PPOX class probable F420-dependent enzyme